MSDQDIEKIFDSRFENEEKPEWFCESSNLSPEDQKWIWDNIPHEIPNGEEKVRFNVKGNQGSMVGGVSSTGSNDIITTKRKSSKDSIAYRLAEKLDDLESLPYYEKLVRERRSDFLKNCLIITLTAFKRGTITKTKAAYFTGVVKRKTTLQERIKRYKQKHTT